MEDQCLSASVAFLQDAGLYTGDGSVDVKGRPALKRTTGNWKACFFILGNFLADAYTRNLWRIIWHSHILLPTLFFCLIYD